MTDSNLLHSQEAEDGVSQRQPRCYRAKDCNEGREAKAQEEQPHTPA